MKYSKKLGSVVLASLLALGFVGCNKDDADGDITTKEVVETPTNETTITPYQRVAIMSGTWDDVATVADKIAQYVVSTDESAVLSYPTNWVIAGANPGAGETYETTDLLPIPVGSNKSRVIEFCNGAYATKATNTGRFHGSALPCEVSVHSDGTNIYIDMLDADAIFSLFFADISDPTGELKTVASAVKSEIRGMILAALADETITESTLQMGPKFGTADIEEVSFKNPYIVYKYEKTDGGTFTSADAKTLAAEIIAKLGTDSATADTNVPGVSSGSAWRTARPEPLAIPGVFVAEACSPKYAKKATALGTEYITALPCEITAYVDETDDTNKTIAISFLNPNFMFGTMFKGAVTTAYTNGTITKDDVVEYSTLADVVFADLRLITDAAIQGSTLGLKIK